MKVHHLNCATLCPPAGRYVSALINDTGTLVCHCLLVESADGLVLVDTGLGTPDLDARTTRTHAAFRALTGPRLVREETASWQVERLGYRAQDVRHIVVTHLDQDHAGGLSDFPEALVHVHADELAAARGATLRERARYQSGQWSHGARFVPHRAGGERWMGFECVRDMAGLPPDILLLPLPGHTKGHSAVAVRGEDGWLVHAGDAYFFHGEMEPVRPHCTPGLTLIQRLDDVDHELRVANQARLRQLAREHAADVRVFCAHDPTELTQLQGRGHAQR